MHILTCHLDLGDREGCHAGWEEVDYWGGPGSWLRANILCPAFEPSYLGGFILPEVNVQKPQM